MVNALWALMANVITAASTWALLIFLAKVADVRTVGAYAVAQAVSLPISMLWGLKLQQVQVTDTRNDYTFGHYYALKVVTAALAASTTAIVGFAVYAADTAWVIAALGVAYAIVEVREVFLATMQKSERMDYIARSRLLADPSALVLFVVLFWSTRSLPWSALGFIVARLAVWIVHDRPINGRLLARQAALHPAVASSVAPCWEWTRLWRLALLAAPLGLVAWFGTLFASVPRLMLEKFVGAEEVGYFAAISSLLVLGNMLTNAMGQTVVPRLAKHYDQDRRAFLILLGKLVGLALAVGTAGILVAVLFGRPVLSLLYTPAYAEPGKVSLLIHLMVAGCVLCLFACANVALTAARKYAVQLPLYGLAALAGVVSAYALVPRYRTIGAAWSLTICYAVGCLGCTLVLVLVLVLRTRPAPHRAT
jgi:O-antigen/teichoic acid export membrane protein